MDKDWQRRQRGVLPLKRKGERKKEKGKSGEGKRLAAVPGFAL
jgi:hypothetical protein